MEIFTKKTTEWMGLWLNKTRQGHKCFLSNTIDLEDLRKFDGKVRLILTRNKGYERGSDKPYFVFCITSVGDNEDGKIEKPEVIDKKETIKENEK